MSQSFKYKGDDERDIPAAGIVVKPGGTFEIEDQDVADGLAGQTDLFEKVPAKTVPKTTSKVEEKV